MGYEALFSTQIIVYVDDNGFITSWIDNSSIDLVEITDEFGEMPLKGQPGAHLTNEEFDALYRAARDAASEVSNKSTEW